MTIRKQAAIVGIHEHPLRHAPDKSVWQLHFEVARGALADAGLSFADVDGYFCGNDATGGGLAMADYLGLRRLRHLDSTDMGGATYVMHLAHAAEAIAMGKCRVALCTLAGKPRTAPPPVVVRGAEGSYEAEYQGSPPNLYALAARRHMHEFGTTSEDLAWIKVAASHHAQHNPNAFLRNVLTVEDVVNSPMVADPLHRMDCCVVTDGGGAFVMTTPEIARELRKPLVSLLGAAETVGGQFGGHGIDLTRSGIADCGPRAIEEADIALSDIKYASIYDSFTITALIQIEDMGFCEKGKGGAFVRDGNLISGIGRLPFNTDGGGLCSNHPQNRGGMTKVLEAVRQLRGEAHPAVQVPNCDLALVTGVGNLLTVRHGAAAAILERSE
ncbi:thiolase domain-containing protein [Martelella lutilitoris]|uniref:Thiolase domain-containing protein n=1 Tax=Martelella lutilitoris TaxID=2583532 RepID=A0A5C4JR72_9HYPH|nr:thiolase domain-containing protein [Martelella lutilitoris]TNB47777.1 thiolase domain-containing protein [Martelella lutilitoris]